MYNQTITLFSNLLNRTIRVRVLHPGTQNCKVLFLLHGYGGTEDKWMEHSCIETLALKHNLAVIMPGCGNGYYENTLEPMKTFLGEELLPYIWRHFSVSRKREDTYIAGASMGGFGALLVGSHYSYFFSKIACISGAFIIQDVLIGNPGVLGKADPNYFKKIFGDFETLEDSDRNPIYEVKLAVTESRMCPVYLVCGDKDALKEPNLQIKKQLDQLNVPNECHIFPGKHDWDFCNEQLPSVIQWLVSP